MTGTRLASSSRRGSIATAAILIASLAMPLLAQSRPSSDEARALLIEYLVTREKSWRARYAATSWRTEVSRFDGDTPVKAISETQCPGAYHLRTIRGSTTTEFYSIAGTEYRQVNGKWVPRAAAKGFFQCASEQEIHRMKENQEPPEAAVMNYLDQILGYWEVEKGPVRTIRGERCQEWKQRSLGNPAENRAPSPMTTQCFSLADSHLVESDGGDAHHPIVTINFDWNKPITIKPPVP